jgi:hypothetical protein
MKKRINKKGQEVMGMSFGVIFSIFLIVFFIVITLIVIKAFLGQKDCAEVGIFIDRLKTEVKKSWNSNSGTYLFKGNVPSKLEYICFANVSGDPTIESSSQMWRDLTLYVGKNANIFFYPAEKACEMPYHYIPHLDLGEIISSDNPLCIPVNKGKVSFEVEKKRGSGLVQINKK